MFQSLNLKIERNSGQNNYEYEKNIYCRNLLELLFYICIVKLKTITNQMPKQIKLLMYRMFDDIDKKTLGHGSSAQDKKKSSYKTQNDVKGLNIEV